MALRDTELFVYMFRGERIKFTDGPYRYIKLASGKTVPLFHVPTADDMSVNETGYFAEESPPPEPLEGAEEEETSAPASEEPPDVYGAEPEADGPSDTQADEPPPCFLHVNNEIGPEL